MMFPKVEVDAVMVIIQLANSRFVSSVFLYQELPSVLFPTVKVTAGLAKCLCAQETSVFAGGIPTAPWSHKNSSNYMKLSKIRLLYSFSGMLLPSLPKPLKLTAGLSKSRIFRETQFKGWLKVSTF